MDAVNNGEGELSLGDIFGKTFGGGILEMKEPLRGFVGTDIIRQEGAHSRALKILVVVSNLKVDLN